jgi:hypothetical protein
MIKFYCSLPSVLDGISGNPLLDNDEMDDSSFRFKCKSVMKERKRERERERESGRVCVNWNARLAHWAKTWTPREASRLGCETGMHEGVK